MNNVRITHRIEGKKLQEKKDCIIKENPNHLNFTKKFDINLIMSKFVRASTNKNVHISTNSPRRSLVASAHSSAELSNIVSHFL